MEAIVREGDIRAELVRSLRAKHDPADTLLVEEFGLAEGAVRIDVAIVNGRLEGYEIKSEQDTLARLPSQERLYSKVFDSVALVTGRRHLDAAILLIPEWWAVVVAEPVADSGVRLLVERAGQQNPTRDLYELASLLWREEALAVLERHGAARGVRTKPRRELWQRLAETLSENALASEVRSALKSREPL